MPFEWDAIKAELNKRKHGISFEEAETVFDDQGCCKDTAGLFTLMVATRRAKLDHVQAILRFRNICYDPAITLPTVEGDLS